MAHFWNIYIVVYKGKFQSKFLIYKSKFSMCDAIYIGNTQQTLKTIMDGHLSNLLHLLKNGQKWYLFAAHLEQNFNTTKARTYLHKHMMFKVVNQINPIGKMKTFTKPNCKICMEKHLRILKNVRNKRVAVVNNDLETYGACRHKITFRRFFPKHWWSRF